MRGPGTWGRAGVAGGAAAAGRCGGAGGADGALGAAGAEALTCGVGVTVGAGRGGTLGVVAAGACGGTTGATGGATGRGGATVAGVTILGATGAGGGVGGAAGLGATGVAAAGLVSCTGGGAGFGGATGAGGAAGCFLSRMAFSTSPGLEICDRSILVLISSGLACGERPVFAELCPSPEPLKCARTFSASCSSSELECVFFSVTPTSVSTSRMALLLTSSSLARSLIRILLIRLFVPPSLSR
jgi:hypothetical protein